MADFDPSAYTITIKRVMTDGELLFRATVAELPDVDAYSETYEEAYNLVIDAVRSLHEIHAQEGRPFPEAYKDEGTFSGRVTLRMGTTLHRKAALIAEREGVSLNQFIVSSVAERVGSSSSSGSWAYFTGNTIWVNDAGSMTMGDVRKIFTAGKAFTTEDPFKDDLIIPAPVISLEEKRVAKRKH